VADPLLIRHQPLHDTYNVVDPYPVTALIRHRSGIASAELYWTTDTANGFSSLPMAATGDDHWAAAIPAQPAGSDVHYYVHATANNGKQQVRPIVAPAGWWRFQVLGSSAGIAETPGSFITDVFPNPASRVMEVRIGLPPGEPLRMQILDALGRVVLRLHNGPVPADGRVFADVSDFAPGAYLIEARTSQGRAVQRLVVK
jgi:agmatine deiminase